MNVSSIPQVIDWLVDAITALPISSTPVLGVGGWYISDGWPDSDAPAKVIVGTLIDATPEDQQTAAGTGRPHPRNEDYLLTVEIHATTGATNQKLVRDTAFDMHNAIAAAINADESLGGLLELAGAQVAGVKLEQTTEDAAPAGRFAIVTTTIRVRNRIRPQ